MSSLPRPLKWPPVFPLEKGLVLWLPFDDRSGARAYDRSGKANHGTLYGPTWVAGRRGGALSFNGISNYLLVADNPVLRLTNKGTITFWFRSGGVRKDWSAFVAKSSGGTTADISYMVSVPDADYLTFVISDGTTTNMLPTSFDFTNTNWHFVAARWDGSFLRMSLDLVETTPGVQTVNAQSTTHPLRLGKYNGGYFYGIIGETRIYDRALNAAEIKRLYESELTLTRW